MNPVQDIIDRVRFPLLGWLTTLNPARIRCRKMLPFYLNYHGLVDEGAEIGVQRGIFSEHLLRYWNGQTLHCIDPWLEFEPRQYFEARDNVSQQTHEMYYAETLQRLSRFKRRAHIIRATSKQAAQQFANGSLDFVFIDAQHHYVAVKEDIELWHPKVRRGGLLCGHDWSLDYGPPHFGVKKAVLEFVERTRCNLLISKDKETWCIPVN